jgi:hypothetical protein
MTEDVRQLLNDLIVTQRDGYYVGGPARFKDAFKSLADRARRLLDAETARDALSVVNHARAQRESDAERAAADAMFKR